MVLLAVTGEDIGDDGADAAGDCSADDNKGSKELAPEMVLGPPPSFFIKPEIWEYVLMCFAYSLCFTFHPPHGPYCLSTPLPSPSCEKSSQISCFDDTLANILLKQPGMVKTLLSS